jgi:hypothetical protein
MTERNIFARSPLSLSAVVIAAASLLAILLGLAFVFGSMLRVSRPPGGAEAMPASMLLTAILVMLVVIAVLLAALVWRVGRPRTNPPR